MSTRTDLLELSVDALTALSNAGFVKRAQKDVVEGKLPEIEQQDDGTVLARYADGVTTTLPPGLPLREARCSCPATGLCRHRVTLVLAYQSRFAGQAGDKRDSAPWCPSTLAGAVELLPRATLDQARRMAAARPAIRLSAGSTPTARLPMCDVRFLSRTSLALARCDCRQAENCAHIALAVWAFAQGERQQPGFAGMTVELDLGAGAAPAQLQDDSGAYEAIVALASQLWLDGTSQNPMLVDTRFEKALQEAGKPGWRWVLEALAQLRGALAGQHARASNADPATLLHLVSMLMARLGAARAQTPLPASQILGVGVSGEVALDHLRLVPMGSQCWSGEAAEGVRLIWADPDTLAVTVMEKTWPRADTGTGAVALRDRRLVGMPLHRLAASQIVTRAARRRANGLLTVGTAATQTSALPLSGSAWDTLASPLRQPDVASLRAHLRSLPPDFVRPLHAIEHVHVVPVAALVDCLWDAASQSLCARVQVAAGEDDLLTLRLRHDPATPGAIDALARALEDEPLAVAGSVSSEAGQLGMTPLALLTAHGLQVPQLAAQGTPAKLASGRHDDKSALHALLEGTIDLLAHSLRQGLRHQGDAALGRAAQQAAALRAAGLGRCAEALATAMDSVKNSDARVLPERLAALYALLHTLASDS
ncbi:hypothetical protein HF313_25625 [Massilia atriviolacea]|uniref:SWIM-type domain-containing protein n=1 Tax=Massilia atriviolacea TaxID=2495579 RepID=A0A430HN10_9BURK|nr:SWIM zinc finger family protein [Massilia atriviolacea]RSZ58948.1 hypothetical protein EJB06_11465 [Massilia atriviolacea]